MKMTDRIQMEMRLPASLARCVCQLKCGVGVDLSGAIGQLQGDVVAEAGAGPATEVN